MPGTSLSSLEPETRELLSGAYWGELRVFAEVARAKSFNRAAESLGISQPTIGRKVHRLQDVMGTQLFITTRQGIRLTQRGEELAAALLVFDQSLFAITSDIKARERDVEGVVRVNITDGLAALFAVPQVPALSRRYPKLQLHIRGVTNFNDLRDNQTDMMLTNAPTDRADMTCRRLGTLHFIPVASRSYVARNGMPRLDNLSDHEFLQSHVFSSAPQIFSKWCARCASGRVAHHCDNSIAHAMMVREGLGIGLLGSYVSREPSSVVLDLDCHTPVKLYGVALTERLETRPVKVVFDWLCDIFDAHTRWFGDQLELHDLPPNVSVINELMTV